MLRIRCHCAGLARSRASPLIRGIPKGAPSCFCREDPGYPTVPPRPRAWVLVPRLRVLQTARARAEGRNRRARPDGQARRQAPEQPPLPLRSIRKCRRGVRTSEPHCAAHHTMGLAARGEGRSGHKAGRAVRATEERLAHGRRESGRHAAEQRKKAAMSPNAYFCPMPGCRVKGNHWQKKALMRNAGRCPMEHKPDL